VAPAFGLATGAFSLGLAREDEFPPHPCPFLRVTRAALVSAAAVWSSGVTLLSFFGMWVAGKSPKGECWDLGSNLLSDALNGFPVLPRILLRWSSLIIAPAWFVALPCII